MRSKNKIPATASTLIQQQQEQPQPDEPPRQAKQQQQQLKPPAEQIPAGWQCPICKVVHSPQIAQCLCETVPQFKVPMYIIRAVESDLEKARNKPHAPGTRIIRGTFVLSYIEQLIKAARPRIW